MSEHHPKTLKRRKISWAWLALAVVLAVAMAGFAPDLLAEGADQGHLLTAATATGPRASSEQVAHGDLDHEPSRPGGDLGSSRRSPMPIGGRMYTGSLSKETTSTSASASAAMGRSGALRTHSLYDTSSATVLAAASAICKRVAPPYGPRHYPAPKPATAAYIKRDDLNMSEAAYGRDCFFATDTDMALDARLDFARAITTEVSHAGQEEEDPYRLSITAGELFPGLDDGNPVRAGWNGTLGMRVGIDYTNRYGSLIRANLFAPLPGARDPYTGKVLTAPFPGVVVTEGSIQATQQMYFWIAEDLAMSGYLVMTYDVQGQGSSETLPHESAPPKILPALTGRLPWCNPTTKPLPGEESGCPGVPSQQTSNFVYGTEDAISFFLSDPSHPYPDPKSGSTPVNHYNPLWRLFNRTPMQHPTTPGRTTRLAIIGHSLGAFAVSYVQSVDPAVAAVVAYDKLISSFSSPGASEAGGGKFTGSIKPVVPALAIQSEYFVSPVPYWLNGTTSFYPTPGSPGKAPNPSREKETGFDAWQKAGVDAMLIVPRSSTHLEYTDFPGAPASRWGQALASYYTRNWLDLYLKHEPGAAAALQARTITYYQPFGRSIWRLVHIHRNRNLSVYFCSAYAFHLPNGDLVSNPDITHDGCPAS